MRLPIAIMPVLKGTELNFWGIKDSDNTIIIPVTDPRKDDIIIPYVSKTHFEQSKLTHTQYSSIMGPSGAGKSNVMSLSALRFRLPVTYS